MEKTEVNNNKTSVDSHAGDESMKANYFFHLFWRYD